MTTPPIWDGALRRLGAEIASFALDAWVRPLAPRLEGDELVLACPSPFHRDRVRERFLAPIVRAARDEAGRSIAITLVVDESMRRTLAPAALHAETRPGVAPRRVAGAAALASAASAARIERTPHQPALPHDFESFVVGPCNALAREAALALAHGRQAGVSPLYLLSARGLGKTHLARAVASEAQRVGGLRVVYSSSEAFTSEFLASIRAQRMAAFKRRFREECDMLVLEDVQFLRGKRSTQLELFHTVEHLIAAGGRIVVTGDCLPREIPEFDARLGSCLASGLVAEMESPDAQLRRRILRAKAAAGGVRLPEDCLGRLVDGVRGSVRDLEGVLIQLVATSTLMKRPIDLPLVEAALRKLAPAEPGSRAARALAPEAVVEVVAGYFRTTPEALAARSRRRDVLVPRQLAMYLARRYTDASLQRIGEALGRDHPAVSHALQVVERQILERAPLRYQVEALAARLDDLMGRRGEGGAARPRPGAPHARPV
jgi:chromosomal replication initiator protein